MSVEDLDVGSFRSVELELLHEKLSIAEQFILSASNGHKLSFELLEPKDTGWEADLTVPFDTIVYQFDGMSSNFGVNCDRLSLVNVDRGEWNFFAAGSQVRENKMKHTGRCALLQFREGLIGNDMELDGLVPPDHSMNMTDKDITHFVEVLSNRLMNHKGQLPPLDQLYVEGIGHAIRASAACRLLPQAKSVLSTPRRGPDPRIIQALDYIETHINHPVTISELASIASVSAGHFARCFKANMGETVWAYVQRRRCERAKEQLLFGSLSLAEVSYRCGFASQAHMTTCIKARFGLTPGMIRREAMS